MRKGFMTRYGLRILVGLAATALLSAVGGNALGAETRNPFVAPEQRINPYHYDRAIRSATVKGILRTESVSACLIQIGESKTLTVLQVGEQISLEYEGAAHLYTIAKIREKSVVFAGKDGRTYEVPIP
jgi:hypothetical protein